MTESLPEPVSMPIARTTHFDPPPELGALRAERPISRMRFPDGHIGWLVTSHALARAVLADRRFSSQNQYRRPVIRLPIVNESGLRPMLPGAFVAMDPPDHTRFRRLLGGQFSERRMRKLESWISGLVDERLDAMELAGRPVDLVQTFALPIPSLVICELLGVPYNDRDKFQYYSEMLVRLDARPEDAEAARVAFLDFLVALVRQKRERLADDLISGLIGTGELTDEEIAGVSFLLLFAGHETTANMIAIGVFTLLSNTEQLAALRADPALVDGAIEELLRYLSVVQLGTVRGALADVVVGGHTIRAGESVCVSLPAANRDPDRFPDPDTVDITRTTTGHMAFGHGIHKCLGAQLARMEMRTGYTALLRRFPGLRLAVDPAEVRMRTDRIIYGVHELPVTW